MTKCWPQSTIATTRCCLDCTWRTVRTKKKEEKDATEWVYQLRRKKKTAVLAVTMTTTHGKQHHQNQENDFQLLSNIHGELCQGYVCSLYSSQVKDAVQGGWIDRSVLVEQLGVSSCCCALIERYVAADYGFYGAILFFSLSDAGHARCCGRSPLANDRHWPWKIANLCLSMSCPSDDFHHPLALYHILAVKQPLHEKLQWMGPTPKN